ncbi:TetR/AcrR family transcriptional regulator [Mycobacterium sp.]|uniref:TetR/AcrR family transcriptional regulator n=1 Tax=Mycobacterium sp. TaxID=1785 RepID=UPI003D0DA6C3
MPPDDCRERLIDAALELFTRQGYDATTADQIAARAAVSDADFAKYFVAKEAVLMSIVDDMAQATAAALRNTARGGDPERALLSATAVSVTAIVEGRGAVPLDHLLAMARIVSTTRNLHRTVSAARRRVLTAPLADWMGVDPTNRRLQRALTMWSAVTASTYVTALEMPEDYTSQGDKRLRQRMMAYLSESFGAVMGVDPQSPE